MVNGEKLYKISYQINVSCEGDNGETIKGAILNSYWIDPQKGYNLVRSETESEILDIHISYIVTLGKVPSQKGEIWFPQEISFKHREEEDILEERVVVDTIAFDVPDETPFTFADLKIPVGYIVVHDNVTKFWDGKELVDGITHKIEPVNIGKWKVFLIVNAIFFALLALLFLYKLLQRRSS
jgi:hypothetical protein